MVAHAVRDEWRLSVLPGPEQLLLPALAWIGRRLGYTGERWGLWPGEAAMRLLLEEAW